MRFVNFSTRVFVSSSTLGRVSGSTFCFVARSIELSMRCSRGVTKRIASPERPARPVRPMRWT